jgi:tRNA-2-methylthio-N6-dimethylallyladenosine synthase
MQRDVGKTFNVLIEGISKKNEQEFYGRNDQNKVVVFPKQDFKKGEYVKVYIHECTAGTLIGKPVE